MMYLALVAFVQGLGELLPISSSSHLFLLSHYMRAPYVSENLDIALHLGSLGAIICYFWRSLWQLIKGTLKSIRTQSITPECTTVITLILASIPVIISGLLVKNYVSVRHTLLGIGIGFILFGGLAMGVEKSGPADQTNVNLKRGILIGSAQVFAFFPGASRLGVCTTMARFLGVCRWEATVFSFLLAIPVLSGAVMVSAYSMIKHETLSQVIHIWPAIVATFFMSLGFFPLLKIFLKRFTFFPFAVYRFIMGIFLVYEAWHLGQWSFP